MSATDFQTLLNVTDVEASAAWYARFGFKIKQQFEDDAGALQWCQLRSSDAVLMLNRQAKISAGDRKKRPDYGDAVFYITVPDAQKAHDMLAEAGIAAPNPEKQMYDVMEFRLRDPDGYEIAIGSAVEPD